MSQGIGGPWPFFDIAAAVDPSVRADPRLVKTVEDGLPHARIAVTSGDEAEDFFTSEVDAAFAATAPPCPPGLAATLREAVDQ